MAHLHLKSALHTNPNYPGLDSVMKYMEQQETEQVIRLSKMSFQVSLLSFVRLGQGCELMTPLLVCRTK